MAIGSARRWSGPHGTIRCKMAITFIDSWLVAEGTDSGRWYVIYMQEPRFVVEICDAEDGGYESGEFMVFDECTDAGVLAKLVREAGMVFTDYDRDLADERGEHF